MLERLAAVQATVQRLAGGGSKGGQALGVRTGAVRARHGRGSAARHKAHGHALAGIYRAGGRNAVGTQFLAAFGSTACKSLWRCLACREPFEHFKPI